MVVADEEDDAGLVWLPDEDSVLVVATTPSEVVVPVATPLELEETLLVLVLALC